jgi:hypothetical protein
MSEAITTNTGTAAPQATSTNTEALSIGSGESPATFEELNALDNSAREAKKEAKKEVKETVKEAVKELSKDDSKKEKSKDEKPPKEAKDKKAGEEEKKDLDPKDKPKEKKTLKAKLGDKELDLDPDVLIPVKINGKEEYLSLNELRSDRSGKVEWDKRFQQLDREKKDFQSKYSKASTQIKSIFEESDPELRLYRMAEFSGVEPKQFREKFLNDNIKLLEKYYSMSDDEKQADALNFENKVLKTQLESRHKADKESNAIRQLDQKVQTLWKAHNVSKDEFLNRYDEIESLIEQGKFKGDVTPEVIVESIAKDRLWDATEDKLKALNVELPIEQRNQHILKLVNDAYSIGINDPADMQDIVERIFYKPKREEVIQAKVEEREEFLEGKKPARKSGPPKEVLLFDDL